MVRPVQGLLALFVVSVSQACAMIDAGTRTVRSDSAGVTLAITSAADRPLNWSFQTLHLLGGKDEGVEAFFRVSSTTVGADAQGNLYVLDGSAYRVVVFSPEGKVLRTMGGMGGGPGEFRAPGSLAVSIAGAVHVFDYAKHKLVRFDAAGRTMPEVEFSFFPSASFQRHLGVLKEGYTVASAVPGKPDGRDLALQLLARADTTRLAALALPESRMVSYPHCGGGLNLPPVFWPEIVWDTDGRRIAANWVPDYVVTLFEKGRVVRSIRRNIDPLEATRDLAMLELGEGFRINFGRGPCTIPPAAMVDGRGYARQVSAIAHVRVSPDGEVWVQRKVVGPLESGLIDVFDAGGMYLGTLPPGSRMPLVLLPQGRAALVLKDDADVERIEVVQITR